MRKGGADNNPVSCAYYVDLEGDAVQLVRDEDTAWHAGRSAWRGLEVNGTLNPVSIGIELSGLNRPDSTYPVAQLAGAAALCRDLVRRYSIARLNLVRHLDISPGRKTDPAGLDWPRFTASVYTYTADAPIIAAPLGTAEQAVAYLARRSTQYTAGDIATIVTVYRREGERVGVDWFAALAQVAHETGGLTAALSGRPTRNPAGIGVTGESSPVAAPGFVWDADRNTYRRALTFARWDPDAVRAHLGRLLAYALPVGTGTPAQQALVHEALSLRPLKDRLRGAAPTLDGLGGTWAYPGQGYGARVALVAERMRTQ